MESWLKPMWKWFRALSLIVVIGASIYFVISAEEPLDAYQERPMPPLELNGLNGGTVSTAKWALETDVLKFINLFASWCTPCIKEIPALQSLRRHLPVYGIAFKDDPDDLKKWLKKHGNPYSEIGIDKGLTFIWDLGVTGVPTTLLLDASQKIVYIHQGLLTEAHIEREILPRLEKMQK